MGFGKGVAVLLGVFASVLIVLAIAVYEGYMPVSLVDNLTDFELGTLGAIAIVGAAGAYAYDASE